MSVEQKLAFASFCSVQFPCQDCRETHATCVLICAGCCRGGLFAGFSASLPEVNQCVVGSAIHLFVCCRSLWREVADGVCSAPLQYEVCHGCISCRHVNFASVFREHVQGLALACTRDCQTVPKSHRLFYFAHAFRHGGLPAGAHIDMICCMASSKITWTPGACKLRACRQALDFAL